MEQYIGTINTVIAVSVIALQVITILVIGLFVSNRKTGHPVLSFISKYALVLGFLFSFASLALSMFYSEVIGFAPCILCWYQRVFMYPQMFIFGLAFIRNERTMLDYSFLLTIAGMCVSIYHVILENLPTGSLPCSATGPSCDIKYVLEFGYITIPVMALTGFVALLVTILIARSLRTPQV